MKSRMCRPRPPVSCPSPAVAARKTSRINALGSFRVNNRLGGESCGLGRRGARGMGHRGAGVSLPCHASSSRDGVGWGGRLEWGGLKSSENERTQPPVPSRPALQADARRRAHAVVRRGRSARRHEASHPTRQFREPLRFSHASRRLLSPEAGLDNYGVPKRLRYSFELINALTISARRKSPPNESSFASQKL
jgi:hypothetical protein